MHTVNRQLLALDAVFAFSGGILYFFAFDFMVGTLGVPYFLARTQLIANFAYAAYGAAMWFTREQRPSALQFLVLMNFVYASFCLLMAAWLGAQGTYWASLLLLAEGVFDCWTRVV